MELANILAMVIGLALCVITAIFLRRAIKDE